MKDSFHYCLLCAIVLPQNERRPHDNLRKTAWHHKANRCSRHHGWRGRQQRCSLLCQELCPFHLCGEVTWIPRKPQLKLKMVERGTKEAPCIIPNLLMQKVMTFVSNRIAPCRQPRVLSAATQVHVDRNLAKKHEKGMPQ